MGDFLSEKALVAVDIGSGWLSRYEAGTLGPGDVVRSESDAGEAQRATLNGEYLCDASVAVAEERFFAKVERLEPESPPPPLPERGEEATELLPFAIRLGSLEVGLGELSGIGPLSFIDLWRGAAGPEDAELLVAGLPLAAGKVAVIDERMGIRITRRLAPPFDGGEMRTTGALLAPGYRAEPIKDYDFRRPDCFTKRGILRARDLHLEFLRTLHARLPSAAGYSLSLVDQLCYREWAEAQPPSGRRYAALPTAPARERSAEGRQMPRKLLLGAAGSGEAGSAVLAGLRAYAERCVTPVGGRPVVVSLEGEARSFLDEDPGLAILASCLRNGWKRVADLRVGPAPGSAAAAPGDEAAYEDEMILLARLESPGGGAVDLVYPLRTLEACFSALNA